MACGEGLDRCSLCLFLFLGETSEYLRSGRALEQEPVHTVHLAKGSNLLFRRQCPKTPHLFPDHLGLRGKLNRHLHGCGLRKSMAELSIVPGCTRAKKAHARTQSRQAETKGSRSPPFAPLRLCARFLTFSPGSTGTPPGRAPPPSASARRSPPASSTSSSACAIRCPPSAPPTSRSAIAP